MSDNQNTIKITSSGLDKKSESNDSDKKTIDNELEQLKTAFEKGKNSTNKINYNTWYNFLLTAFSTTIAICIGIIICYLIYVFC